MSFVWVLWFIANHFSSVSSLSRSSASSSTSSSSANILGPYSISSTSTTPTATIGAIPPYATPIGSRTSSPHIPLAVTSSSPSIGSSQSPYSKPSAVWPVLVFTSNTKFSRLHIYMIIFCEKMSCPWGSSFFICSLLSLLLEKYFCSSKFVFHFVYCSVIN